MNKKETSATTSMRMTKKKHEEEAKRPNYERDSEGNYSICAVREYSKQGRFSRVIKTLKRESASCRDRL
jgi:hypothetical protein